MGILLYLNYHVFRQFWRKGPLFYPLPSLPLCSSMSRTINSWSIKQRSLGESHGLVVKADISWPKGCGFKPWYRILDGCQWFASYYINRKIENKGSQMGHTKKIFFFFLYLHSLLLFYIERKTNIFGTKKMEDIFLISKVRKYPQG